MQKRWLTKQLSLNMLEVVFLYLGTYGGFQKPSPFVCLLLKMLQIQPEKEIVLEFVKNTDYKYVTALGAFYCRMIFPPAEVFNILEILYTDLRKLRFRNSDGTFTIVYMDEIIDNLLHLETFCSIVLPRIPKRHVLESQKLLGPRISPLEEDLETEIQNERLKLLKEEVGEEENEEEKKKKADAKKWKKVLKKQRREEKEKKKKAKKEKKKEKKKKRERSFENSEKIKKENKKEETKPTENSVEYWNQIRSQLGMKLLQ